jgi:hypothetical protein
MVTTFAGPLKDEEWTELLSWDEEGRNFPPLRNALRATISSKRKGKNITGLMTAPN